jgi:hypothetical protein
MTYLRLPYDDASTTTDMTVDCAEVSRTMHVQPRRRSLHDRSLAGAAVTPPAGSTPVVPVDLARRAAGMQLPFD